MIELPVFIGRKKCFIYFKAKERFFCTIQIFNMDIGKLIIWKSLHVVEDDPVYNEYGEPGNKPPGGTGKKIKQVKKNDQYKLVCFITDEYS